MSSSVSTRWASGGMNQCSSVQKLEIFQLCLLARNVARYRSLHIVANTNIRLIVKVGKEQEKHHSVHANQPHERFGKVAINKQQLKLVHGKDNELNHLKFREVFLPPTIRPESRSQRSQHVVEIHENMHERVEESEERRVSTRNESDAEPDGKRHDAVVNDVKPGNLIVFLAQNEKHLDFFFGWGEVNNNK